MAPTCFGQLPSSGSLQLSLAKAQHTVCTPYRDMLPHHRITNNDITLLNVSISI